MNTMVELRDGVEGLLTLNSNSIDLVLSDLPSGSTQAPFDRVPDLRRFWPAVWNCLKPNGIVVLMASSLRFASTLLASQEARFRYDLIWSKSLATGHLNAQLAPLRSHENILVFSRARGCYYPQMTEGASPIHACRKKAGAEGENYGKTTTVTHSRAGKTDRYPVSVLEFASVGTSSKDRVHPQQKPVSLLRWLIRSYSTPGDWIVDPYAGSGSTGIAAREESRNFIGFDSDPRFGAAECFTCGGTGEIDETIGGAVMARHDSHAPCPDCQNPRCRVGGPHHLVGDKS